MNIKEFSIKIRRRETPFYDRIYRLAKSLRRIEVPAIGPLYKFLYYERKVRLNLWDNCLRVFYYTPMFRTQCSQVGKWLYLINGFPLITGNLSIKIGNEVTIFGKTTLNGTKVVNMPTLEIGDYSYIGYQVTIYVGDLVKIGKHVLISNNVFIAGEDGHPVNLLMRQKDMSPPKESVKPIIIGDNVWLGEKSIILKGVTIGKGAIVGAGAVVTRDVLPMTIVAGNPVKIVKEIHSKN